MSKSPLTNNQPVGSNLWGDIISTDDPIKIFLKLAYVVPHMIQPFLKDLYGVVIGT